MKGYGRFLLSDLQLIEGFIKNLRKPLNLILQPMNFQLFSGIVKELSVNVQATIF